MPTMPNAPTSDRVTNCPCWRHTVCMFQPPNYNLSTNQSCLLIQNESYALLNGTYVLSYVSFHCVGIGCHSERMQTAAHSVFLYSTCLSLASSINIDYLS